MASAHSIWLTRPAGDNDALLRRLEQAGIGSIDAPVMTLERITPPLAEITPNAVLLTSRHAAAAILPPWHSLPVYCVGEATAQAARAAGCTQVIAGPGEVLALLPLLKEAFTAQQPILYLSGEEVRFNLPAMAAAHHLHIQRTIVYRMHEVSSLPASVDTALRQGTLRGVACFSPHTARVITRLVEEAGLRKTVHPVECYTLSLAVAEAAAALPWKAIHACHTPSTEAMAEVIVSRCHP